MTDREFRDNALIAVSASLAAVQQPTPSQFTPDTALLPVHEVASRAAGSNGGEEVSYPIKRLNDLLIPDPFPVVKFTELMPEQLKSIVDTLTNQAAREFNARVREAFRTQFVDSPGFDMFSAAREDADRSVAGLVMSVDPVLDGYRW